MDAIVVGIDIPKDHLDVAVHQSGEVFAVPRDAAGLDAPAARQAEPVRLRRKVKGERNLLLAV